MSTGNEWAEDSTEDTLALLSQALSDSNDVPDAILDTLLGDMYIAFVLRSKAQDGTIDALVGTGNIVHSELVFGVQCKGMKEAAPCWCSSHRGFQHSQEMPAREAGGKGDVRIVFNPQHKKFDDREQYTYHSVSFAAFRWPVPEIFKYIANRGPGGHNRVGGVVMRLDPYLTNHSSGDPLRYTFFRLHPMPNATELMQRQAVRDVFQWCIRQCVDQTNQTMFRPRGYAHTRALVCAVLGWFVRTHNRLGRMLSSPSQPLVSKRDRWFCSEFVVHALYRTGVFNGIVGGTLPSICMNPTNLYNTLLHVVNNDRTGRPLISLSTALGTELERIVKEMEKRALEARNVRTRTSE